MERRQPKYVQLALLFSAAIGAEVTAEDDGASREEVGFILSGRKRRKCDQKGTSRDKKITPAKGIVRH